MSSKSKLAYSSNGEKSKLIGCIYSLGKNCNVRMEIQERLYRKKAAKQIIKEPEGMMGLLGEVSSKAAWADQELQLLVMFCQQCPLWRKKE